jgi:hypothetical protein
MYVIVLELELSSLSLALASGSAGLSSLSGFLLGATGELPCSERRRFSEEIYEARSARALY